MRVLVTGAAGFIGFFVAKALLERGDEVVGLDNLNDYYDVKLKRDRLHQLDPFENFTFVQADIADKLAIDALFRRAKPQRVIHLAAQAGVRYSLTHPEKYIDANLVGFSNILEASRRAEVRHLVFASSSSVYGANTKIPFSVHDNVDHPLSLYAATKKANELMAHTYAHLYRLPVTGLRFFTVYGPWGRPDMALYKFVNCIFANKPIDIYNRGEHARDFTYIDDAVEGVIRSMDHVAAPNVEWTGDEPDPATSAAPYRIYNLGNRSPVKLMDFISIVEQACGRVAQKNFLPMQLGDVPTTYADVSALAADLNFRPSTPIRAGVEMFVQWYRSYYGT